MLNMQDVRRQYDELVTWHGYETALATELRHHLEHAMQQQDPHAQLAIPCDQPTMMQ